MEEILQKLQRSTDDATAYPVFLIMKNSYEVSQSAYKSVTLADYEGTRREFSVHLLAGEICFDDWFDGDGNFDDDDVLAKYFEDEGYRYYIDNDNENLYYWSKEDEIEVPMVDGVAWTREEANDYCKANSHNGEYYSYSVAARGVLKELMNFTCERERLSESRREKKTERVCYELPYAKG